MKNVGNGDFTMKKSIGIFGISANPPHRGHEILIASLLKQHYFDVLFLILTGERKDKQYVHPDHRVAMTELAMCKFRYFQNHFFIRYSDVYSKNTPTIILLNRMKEEFLDTNITFIVGSDLIESSEIKKSWYHGEKLLNEYDFLIVPRSDEKTVCLHTENLPKKFKIFNTVVPAISSTEIRNNIKKGYDYLNFISIDVANYIEKYKLYKES